MRKLGNIWAFRERRNGGYGGTGERSGDAEATATAATKNERPLYAPLCFSWGRGRHRQCLILLVHTADIGYCDNLGTRTKNSHKAIIIKY